MAGPPNTPETKLGPENIEAVYRAHAGRCYALAIRIVRDRHLAQDVLQDTFAALHQSADRFDPARGSISTWVLTLTHHKAVDLVRRRRTRTGLDTTIDEASTVIDLSPTPEDQAGVSDERARTRAAMKVLNRGQREVIVLAYFDGYTQSEIAAKTGIPLGTVKSRTVSALIRLRGEIAPDGRLVPAA